MGQRRILVIGSQCNALTPLSFLPDAAEQLYSVMTNPDRGGCAPAIGSTGLLIDPSVKETKAAIESAFLSAAKDEATLFIAFIGHGERVSDNFYLMPQDADPQPTSDTAIHLINFIAELHQKRKGEVDGLGVLVDACFSGSAGFGAAQSWIADLKGMLRFELFTATSDDRTAADGCFTLSLAKLLREGVSEEPAEHLRCNNLRQLISKSCPNQEPQHPSYNPDLTLWLSKNAGSNQEPWARTPLADHIQKLTLTYQVTPALSDVVAHSHAHRYVAVVGDAGAGKSALAAALAWPKIGEGIVPAEFTHAVALITEATTPHELAGTITEQLTRSVPGFTVAQKLFAQKTPSARLQEMEVLKRRLVGPLQQLASTSDVRLVVDALDRLATGADSVMGTLDELIKLPFIRLIVTTRPETPLPETAYSYALSPASEEIVNQYLTRRSVTRARHAEVNRSAQGNWLIVRVLADLLSNQPDAETSSSQLALGDAYDALLSRCGAIDNVNTKFVLVVLAVAGAGPLLPLPLLGQACKTLGGLGTEAVIHNELYRLRGLTARSAAGTENEHVGLFHQTLVDHVVTHWPREARNAHLALIRSMPFFSPEASEPIDLNDNVQRYIFEREAEHFFAVDMIRKALDSISRWKVASPIDNLRRWQLWAQKISPLLDADDPDSLMIRSNIALYTGEIGDTHEAVRLFLELLPDMERIFETDAKITLLTRSRIAINLAKSGKVREALHIFQALLPTISLKFGNNDRETLVLRLRIALSTGLCGDVCKSLHLSTKLLPVMKRELGATDPYTLSLRGNIAGMIYQCMKDAGEALRLFQDIFPDQERVLGSDHPETLMTRRNIAATTANCGDLRKALGLFQALLPDQERVLGVEHPDTLVTKQSILDLNRG